MSDYLPDEVIVEILARLPVKSILRYTAVCKQWYSIITNPNFVTTHLERFGETTTDQILLNVWNCPSDNHIHNRQGHYFLLPDDKEFGTNRIELEFPFKNFNDGYYIFLGSCNGLVCLCKYTNNYQARYAKNVIIWNPCIRRSVTLTLPLRNRDRCTLGFGFDLLKKVFKVVSFVDGKLMQIMVYELGRGEEEWRVIACSLSTHYRVMFSQVFLRGSVYWLAFDESLGFDEGHKNLIIALGMTDEIFTEIPLPPVVAKRAPVSLAVTRVKDSLAVLSGIQCGSEICSVWVMKEYGAFESWTNLYTIKLPELGFPKPITMPLGFRENGEVVLLSATEEVISYDSKTEATTNSGIFGGLMKVENFTESLVLLEDGDRYE